MRPSLRAVLMAAARFWASSFARIFRTCHFTVVSDVIVWSAICRFV